MKLEVANSMTPQELCDYSVKGIVAQKGQCMNDDNICRYSAGERHCAIGQITDPKYHKGWEGGGLFSLSLTGGMKGMPQPVIDNLDLFIQLQAFHDSSETEDRILGRHKLEKDYGIDTSGEHWQQWTDLRDEVSA